MSPSPLIYHAMLIVGVNFSMLSRILLKDIIMASFVQAAKLYYSAFIA